MPIPTTDMSGYTDLRGRIIQALGRCQEQSWLDFKESQPWVALRWRLLKTIMAMSNLRDGGLILIGVAEKGTAWELTGIRDDHLSTFKYNDIADQLKKYASPHVSFDLVVHPHDDGNSYLAFRVHQFNESPVVCCRNSSQEAKDKDRFCAGDVYVRPTTGKPCTEKITDAAQLHDLLDLAAEFRARKLLETGRRIGLVPGDSATALFDAELVDQ
jgi:predicted HTH transcriptional regulator